MPDKDPTEGDAGQHAPRYGRGIAIAVAVLALLGVGLYFGLPWLEGYLNHVSTDDAYVSGHITYLGPRIASRVEEVLVDEDDFIRAGEVVIRLDAEPFRLAVQKAQADLQLAQASLAEAQAGVRGQLSTARANQYLAQLAIDQVRSRVASLEAAVAELKLDEAKLALAEKTFARDAKLITSKSISQQDYDQDRAALDVARDQAASQKKAIQQIRAGLGLPANPANPAEVPKDIGSQYPQVQAALSNWATSLIQIGAPVSILGRSVEAVRKQLEDWLAARISNQKAEAVVEEAPAVQVARAKVAQAEAALEQAKLDLEYSEIKAPFDGFLTKRTVNPGDYVSPGQNLLAVQSLRDVWVDANFKETQLAELRIGQPVRVYVDAYPGKVFSGRVAGFSAATGSRLSLLPPENATGNFVKTGARSCCRCWCRR